MRTNRGAFGLGAALGLLLTTSMAWAGAGEGSSNAYAVGAPLIGFGIVAVAYGALSQAKARRALEAPLARTADVARGQVRVGANRQVSVHGGVICVRALVAPVSGKPCLFYRVTRTAKWNDGDKIASKVLDQQVRAAHFAVDDGSGAVWIDARHGGDFEPMLRRTDAKSGAFGTTYEIEEEILPVLPRIYVCGRAPERGGAIEASTFRPLIISSKTRDELIGGSLARVVRETLETVTTRRSF